MRGPYRKEVEDLYSNEPCVPGKAPGWFVDTRDGRKLRWWDGKTWTSKVWGGERTVRAPLPRELADLGKRRPYGPSEGVEGWFVDPRNVSRLRWWDGANWAARTWTKDGAAAENSATRERGRIEASCPTCEGGHVEAAAELKTIRGYLVYCTVGAIWAVGCKTCVSKEARRVAGRNMLTGWWSFPWGLTTPVVVIGNIWRGFFPMRRALDKFAQESGIDLDKFTVGEDGMTPEERNMITVLLLAAGRLGESGRRPAIVVAAVEFAEKSILAAPVPRERISALGEAGSATLDGIEREVLLAYLRILARAIEETGEVGDVLVAELRALCTDFGVGIRVEELLSMPRDGRGGRAEPRSGRPGAEEPYKKLGLGPEASLREVKERHRELVLRHHPDRAQARGGDVVEATRRTQEVNQAYQEILRALGN